MPVLVLLDYVRADRLRSGKPETDEEHKLAELVRENRRRHNKMKAFGLRRPDITAYLSEAAVRSIHPQFPGWEPVVQRFESLRHRPAFKDWVRDHYGVSLTTRDLQELLDTLLRDGHRPVGELTKTANEIVAAVTS